MFQQVQTVKELRELGEAGLLWYKNWSDGVLRPSVMEAKTWKYMTTSAARQRLKTYFILLEE